LSKWADRFDPFTNDESFGDIDTFAENYTALTLGEIQGRSKPSENAKIKEDSFFAGILFLF
jgi:hypothetical protein